MIKIVAGTFGYFNGRKKEMITAASGARSFDPKLEARLVSEGVAEYVDAPKAKDDQWPNPVPPSPELSTPDEVNATETADVKECVTEYVEYSPDMKLADLKAIGEQYGLDVKSFKSKAEVIAALDSYFAANASDNEPPPVFGTDSVK